MSRRIEVLSFVDLTNRAGGAKSPRCGGPRPPGHPADGQAIRFRRGDAWPLRRCMGASGFAKALSRKYANTFSRCSQVLRRLRLAVPPINANRAALRRTLAQDAAHAHRAKAGVR